MAPVKTIAANHVEVHMEPLSAPMRMLRLKEVVRVKGLARMTIWRLERKGEFPLRRQLGPRSVAWLQGDVEEWIASRPVKPARARRNSDTITNRAVEVRTDRD